jgi:hypothetical protein
MRTQSALFDILEISRTSGQTASPFLVVILSLGVSADGKSGRTSWAPQRLIVRKPRLFGRGFPLLSRKNAAACG